MATNANPGMGGNDRSSIEYGQNDMNQNQSSTSAGENSNIHTNANLHQRIFVIKSDELNRNISEMSPFLLEKAIKGTVGTVKNVRKLRSGLLLVEVASEAQARTITNVKQLHDMKVTVSPHRSLNSCTGVITSTELSKLKEEEIQAELEEIGVRKVKIITTRQGDDRVNTSTMILTFKGTHLPSYTYAGYMRIKVRAYIPPPRRCFKCQKYGHFQSTCKQKETCAKCGKDKHEGGCSGPKKCVNCEGDHAAYDKECPRLKKEKAISKIQVEQKKPYSEAQKIQEARSQTPAKPNYAAAAGGNTTSPTTMCNAETQTVCKCVCACAINLESTDRVMYARVKTRTTADGSTNTQPCDHQTQPSTSGCATNQTTNSGKKVPDLRLSGHQQHSSGPDAGKGKERQSRPRDSKRKLDSPPTSSNKESKVGKPNTTPPDRSGSYGGRPRSPSTSTSTSRTRSQGKPSIKELAYPFYASDRPNAEPTNQSASRTTKSSKDV